MSPEEIAERYADALSADAVKELTDDIREAVKERDMEWWEKCCLVDNVEPTPDGVSQWVTIYGQYCSETERERCFQIVLTYDDPIQGLSPVETRERIADVIRCGTPPATEPPAPSPPQSDGGSP